MTPFCGESPIGHPPTKCAVIGMFAISPQLPKASPSMIRASLRDASLPTGIQVGFGAP